MIYVIAAAALVFAYREVAGCARAMREVKEGRERMRSYGAPS